MTTREDIIALAKECGFVSLDIEIIADKAVPMFEAFFNAAQCQRGRDEHNNFMQRNNQVVALYDNPATSVPEWQPIETAPMLKTVLLAVEFDGPGDWRIKCGSFYSNEWHVFGASWKPTHWMPLPKPPVSARSN